MPHKTIICPHWIPAHAGPEDKASFARWNAPYIKIVINDDKVPYLDYIPPGTTLDIRCHPMSENWEARGIRDAAHAREMAHSHVDYCRRIAGSIPSGVTAVYELMNEPHLWSDEPPELVAEYSKEALHYGHSFGLRFVVGLFGVGWPGNGGVADAPVQWDFFRDALGAMWAGDYLGLHEYWALNGPPENWQWWAGRYEQCPYDVPILITECGIDTGVAGTWYGGWHDLPGSYEDKARRYVQELAWYESQCKDDGRVKGVFPFTFDIASDHWQKFNLRNESFLNAFFSWMEAQPPLDEPVPQPEPEPIPMPDNIKRQISERAWIEMGVSRNPDSAFYKAAAALAIGAPMWSEGRVNGYAWQPFANGILYCKEGDWGNIQELDWYDDGIMRLVHPIADPAQRRLTQGWGERPEYYSQFVYGGVPLKGHNGIDYGLTVGNTIVTCDNGTVREAAFDSGGWGIYVKVIHAWGESLYAHLMSMDVAAGDAVIAGQIIGQSGNTGNSTGAHLHFGIRINPYSRNDGWGGFSDPTQYL